LASPGTEQPLARSRSCQKRHNSGVLRYPVGQGRHIASLCWAWKLPAARLAANLLGPSASASERQDDWAQRRRFTQSVVRRGTLRGDNWRLRGSKVGQLHRQLQRYLWAGPLGASTRGGHSPTGYFRVKQPKMAVFRPAKRRGHRFERQSHFGFHRPERRPVDAAPDGPVCAPQLAKKKYHRTAPRF